ncbi:MULTISPECIES: LexA family protein [Microvirgula]|nr:MULTISPECIES: translesion error-prone DNA polymerase V autoproteolytic subunit [Microvirgula]RAS19098.1 DNA polymerase V [Microvirgula sp. AG722]
MSETPKPRQRKPGAGRKAGTGQFGGEPTVIVRLPEADRDSLLELARLRSERRRGLFPPLPADQVYRPMPDAPRVAIPLAGVSVRAGLPSPAADFESEQLDLNDYLLRDAPSTIMYRVKGLSMIGCGIDEGDLLVIDRKLEAGHNDIVLAEIPGEGATVKRLYRKGGRVALLPENPDFEPMEFCGEQELLLVGVVTGCIKKFR